MRIVSLLPSATEMICVLGLADQLVGVTHECDYPAAIAGRPIVTRTLIPKSATSAQIDALVRERVAARTPLYELDVPTLLALRPDLIVTQALCDVCAVDETEVRQAACSMPWAPMILNLEPMSLPGVFDAILDVATAAGVADRGTSVAAALESRVAAIAERTSQIEHKTSVVFLEWLDPLFCAGHWNPELVALAGGRECIGVAGERSRRIEWNQLRQIDPEVLFIACCGFSVERTLADIPILRGRPGWEDLRAVRNNRVLVADGSAYFNRPGPRLVDSLEILANALHPKIGPPPPASHARQLAADEIATIR
jgi:iron complex transport system substrate-binding protein